MLYLVSYIHGELGCYYITTDEEIYLCLAHNVCTRFIMLPCRGMQYYDM